MVQHQLIKGLSDPQIQEHVLAHAATNEGSSMDLAGGRNSRVFGEKLCDKFVTKFGEEFSEFAKFFTKFGEESGASPTLVTISVTYFVTNIVAHLYLHQI